VIVVSDTTAVTNLLAIHREELLEQLFGCVVVPEAVLRELQISHAFLPKFLELREVQDSGQVEALQPGLDLGEAEAIVLAEELNADYLLIGEDAGRNVAEQRGVRIIGLPGILGRAKLRGLITTVRPEIDALQSQAGFWISPQLRERVLRDLGEA
jgi:predicted nucleic acid-binding protein